MSLKLWLPLTGSFDNKGVSSNSITGTNTTFNANGKIGSCCSLTGNGYIKLAKALFNASSTEFSYCCWVKVNTTDSMCLYSNRSAINPNGFTIFINNSGKILFDTGERMEISYAINTNTWTHLAFIWKKNGEKQLFVNGSYTAGATSQTSNPTGATTVNAFIGASQDSTTTVSANYLNGYINDVRIYDHCLSALEIKEISKCLMAHYKLDDIMLPNLLNGNVNIVSSYTQDGITLEQEGDALKCTRTGGYNRFYRGVSNVWTPVNSTFTVSFDAKAQTDGLQIYTSRSNLDGTNNCNYTLTTEWAHYSGQIINTESVTGGTLSIGSTTSGAVFWIRNIKLERGDVETPFNMYGSDNKVPDSSGFGHTGVLSGSVYLSKETKRQTACVHVQNNASCVSLYSNPIRSADNKFSFNLWMKCTTSATNAKQLAIRLNDDLYFNFGRSSASSNTAYQFFTFTSTYYIGLGMNVSMGEWHMWSGTYDGTTAKLYKDGILLTSGTDHVAYTYTADNNHILGTAAPISDVCEVSDIRIYGTVLSSNDILCLYDKGMSIDKKSNIWPYALIENSKNLFKLSTVTNHNGTLTILKNGIKIAATSSMQWCSTKTPTATTLGLVNGKTYVVFAHVKVISGVGYASFRKSSNNQIITGTGQLSGEQDISFTYTYDSSVPSYLSLFCTWETASTGEVEYTNIHIAEISSQSASLSKTCIFTGDQFIESDSARIGNHYILANNFMET